MSISSISPGLPTFQPQANLKTPIQFGKSDDVSEKDLQLLEADAQMQVYMNEIHETDMRHQKIRAQREADKRFEAEHPTLFKLREKLKAFFNNDDDGPGSGGGGGTRRFLEKIGIIPTLKPVRIED